MTPHEYANAHQDQFLSELIELLRIPSVSSTPAHAPAMQRAATWLHDHLRALGFEAQVYQTPGHPIVYGAWMQAGPDAPTILVYGHYDVQPPDPLDQWHTPPFEPTVRDGNLYARGASDDKGQCFAHLKAAESILRAGGRLPVNLKFILEGEEEKGSVHIKPFVQAHQDLLAADVVLVSDTANKSLNQPSIIYGLRGICYMELEVRGPRTDLHSGSYGGMVHNPAQALCEIVAQLHDANGTITIPGFYDRVRPLSDEERAAMAQAPYTEQDLLRATGVPASWGEAEYALHERTGARPTLEVNGLLSGWTGEGAKTVLPARALAKISCRLVPDQDPADILELVRDHVARLTPPTVTSEVRLLHDGYPVITDIHAPAMQTAIAAYEEGWGARPVFTREGGSISVVVEFQRALGAPVVLIGFGLPDDGLHAPNEKFSLECFRRGVATAISFYQKFTK